MGDTAGFQKVVWSHMGEYISSGAISVNGKTTCQPSRLAYAHGAVMTRANCMKKPKKKCEHRCSKQETVWEGVEDKVCRLCGTVHRAVLTGTEKLKSGYRKEKLK